ncbi:MAG: response regulator [Clostridia bacterium]|nr:response regulator [Clostridia bacterium]
MFGNRFQLNDQTIPMVEEIGRHMPGGFFIYKAEKPEELLYANRAVFDIFGCADLEEFKALTGYTFKGMLYPEDYQAIVESIDDQIAKSDDNLDYVEYRIVRRDGTVRWVDDYGHYTETEAYGGIYYVFISDITEKRERMASDLAVRQAVIEALSEAYHTVWLINDVKTESFSLFRGDTQGDTMHAFPIREALGRMKYSMAKASYIQTMVAPVDQERLQRELELSAIVERLRQKPQFSINYLRRTEDGTERYFRIEFAKVNMPGGKMGIVCGFKDVDEDVRQGQAVQKKLQEAKRAEEENRRLIAEIQSAEKLATLMGSVASLLSNMPAMSFSKDAETGRYLACNQSFAEYAHKPSPEAVVGLTDYEIFDSETARHFVEDDQKALDMEEPHIFFEDVPDAGGKQIRNLQTTKLKFFDASGRLCVLGMCVDITEMTRIKEAEARQQEMEQRLALQEKLLNEEHQRAEQDRLITALASDYRGVYYVVLDNDEGVCYQVHSELEHGFRVGERFAYLEDITGYAQEYVSDAYREEFLNFIQPDAIRAGLISERVISFRYKVIRRGRESYEMIRFAGVRHPEDRDDHVVHAVSMCFVDVDSEMRQAMEHSRTLGAALSAAEEANKAKTAFLSNMSHEIRTPMNAIIGLDNIALSNPHIPDETRDQLEKIGASAQHLLSIINDILDMSRIESGRMVISNEEFLFAKLMDQVNTIISGQCRDKGLDYVCRTEGKLFDYYIGDVMKLRQVLINILGNAVKFTPEGGTVEFVTEALNCFDGKAALRFTVRDTGIGMSPEYLPKIFDAFSQEDSSSTNKYGSTGLGMPITKSLLELMNGNIAVESQKGVGTTFTVTVPLAVSSRTASDADEGELHLNDMTVLVIDDDPVACEHARLVLGQVGVSCDAALSGEEGIEMIRMHHARRNPYNLILVDWQMPGMDGVETTRRIRELIGNGSAIIILTSYSWDDVAEDAREAGVDTFVPKPLYAENVMDEFRAAFRRKKALPSRQQADLKGRHILLAEDVMVNAEIMIMVLGMREIEVDHAENGCLAVEMFEQHENGYYDAILMDMRMPVMDGLEATRTIRALERPDAKTVPIIALTANAFDEDVQRSMQAGLNAHLSKPVQPEALFETLESLISI